MWRELRSRVGARTSLVGSLILVGFLAGCATPSIRSLPPVPPELLVRCVGPKADPLTTADQFDLARALTQSVAWARDCARKHDALVDAVEVRQGVGNAK